MSDWETNIEIVMGEEVWNPQALNDLFTSIKDDLNRFSDKLASISAQLNKIANGDDKGAYWQGPEGNYYARIVSDILNECVVVYNNCYNRANGVGYKADLLNTKNKKK